MRKSSDNNEGIGISDTNQNRTKLSRSHSFSGTDSNILGICLIRQRKTRRIYRIDERRLEWLR
jgi:hypothetical protein